jgi:hypothetical protein
MEWECLGPGACLQVEALGGAADAARRVSCRGGCPVPSGERLLAAWGREGVWLARRWHHGRSVVTMGICLAWDE